MVDYTEHTFISAISQRTPHIIKQIICQNIHLLSKMIYLFLNCIFNPLIHFIWFVIRLSGSIHTCSHIHLRHTEIIGFCLCTEYYYLGDNYCDFKMFWSVATTKYGDLWPWIGSVIKNIVASALATMNCGGPRSQKNPFMVNQIVT